jgi:hypothetical protein
MTPNRRERVRHISPTFLRSELTVFFRGEKNTPLFWRIWKKRYTEKIGSIAMRESCVWRWSCVRLGEEE